MIKISRWVLAVVTVVTIAAWAGPLLAEDAPLQTNGFVDVYYSHNTNNPKSRLNGFANFDFHHKTFSLNLAELQFKKTAAPVGFRVDLDFGETTDLVHCARLSCGKVVSDEEPYKNVQQAYLTWAGPSGFTMDAGKFVTHMGAEVIETKDNWNYTRGLLFAFAIPYYHAGVRFNYPVSDKVFLNGYVYNGWNNVVETNSKKTYGVQIGLTPVKQFPILLSWLGPEDTATGKDRHVYEITATLLASDQVSLMLDYNHGREDLKTGGTGTYKGFALYGRVVSASRPCALAVRYERTDDDDNLMYGTLTSPKVSEVTVTGEHVVAKNLLARLEFRHDTSDKDIFEDRNGVTDSQNRIVAGLVYSF